MTAARLPVVKHLERFSLEGTPINEGLIRSLHDGSFLPARRNIVLVGGTGTGKTHLAIAITANVVRKGARARYFNTVDLVTRLEEETRIAKGQLALQKPLLTGTLPHSFRTDLRWVRLRPGYARPPPHPAQGVLHNPPPNIERGSLFNADTGSRLRMMT